ncbi:MAG: MXAN_6640 family putative metalloprotease, partial [candidate division Zixibacteria bacterium]|nr:MXAN_6640 family putative metalloprotease [candidate division Zixibacteria bacterium]
GKPLPIKCGTSAIADFILNRDKLDEGLMKSLGVQVYDRPPLIDEQTYDTPDGFFKIHYSTVGNDSVYKASVDNAPANGIPDYVDSVAWICDSVYNHIINVLGYPSPPTDGFYDTLSGDNRYDVYLSDLYSGMYGQTWIDNFAEGEEGGQRVTSFIEIDKDYQGLSMYVDCPVNAVRVTMAHEFFHAVQFGIDFTETELFIRNTTPPDTTVARYWMEMSAVWMEEEIYDDINDFYYYLPYFFNDPSSSIQQFDIGDVHPYASTIFPMYLSETYGRDIIKDIWLRCGTMGPRANFLKATHNAVNAASDNTAGWASAFRDFALWNYFTGPRAQFAPTGVGYSERDNFPAFPDSMMAIHTNYTPTIYIPSVDNTHKPRHNSASYMVFKYPELTAGIDTSFYICNRYDCIDSTQVNGWENPDMRYLDTSTCTRTCWRCNEDTGSVCFDSSKVNDTTGLGFYHDFYHLDSVLDINLSLGDGLCSGEETFPLPWGLSVIYQMKHDTTIYEIDPILFPDDTVSHLGIAHPDSFQSIAMILTPATYDSSYYQPFKPNHRIDLGYWVEEKPDDTVTSNRPNAQLTPYPNPAAINEMTDPEIMLRFQIATDSTSLPIYNSTHLVVDIFNVAGERVQTLTGYTDTGIPTRYGMREIAWNMKNSAGMDVASGVYIAYGRLYSSANSKMLLAEGYTKVVVIR